VNTVSVSIERHALPIYFALVFLISWGSVLAVVGGPAAMPGTAEEAGVLLPFVVLAMLAGPPVASILLTGVVEGEKGLRELLARMLTWRVKGRWYAVAILGAPLLVTAVLLALSLTSRRYVPGILTTQDKATAVLTWTLYGLAAGLLEELGWTGFAVPRLRLRYGVLTTGLIVGIPWGVWHFISNYWGSGDSAGVLSLGLFVPAQVFAIGALPAFRVLMVWVYDRAQSLAVAMLMHASITASWLIVMPEGISGSPFLTWYLAWSACLWVIVAAVGVMDRRKSERRGVCMTAA
jgi:membrane protease YdiL (CAAX protease family)